MCYLTNWSHRRPGAGKFVPEDIDPTLCTHIVYSFATLKNYLLAEESEKDTEMYERLIALRNKNPDIKVESYFSYISIDIDTFDTYFDTYQADRGIYYRLNNFSDIIGDRWLGFRINPVQRTNQ